MKNFVNSQNAKIFANAEGLREGEMDMSFSLPYLKEIMNSQIQIAPDEKIALEQRRAEAQVCVDLIELLRKKGENYDNPKVDECQKKITDLGFINEGGKAMTFPDEWLNYQKRAKLTDSQGSNQVGDTKPKVDVNTAIFGAIGGGAGYLVAKNLIKTDKVIIPILIGAAAFAYYHIDMSKKMAGKSW